MAIRRTTAREILMAANMGGSTIDEAEVARFSALADEWWDFSGKMGMLHKFNPVRLDSLAGLRFLDIGCGGGILSEPLARLGAAVVGADPAAANIAAAKLHAAG